MTSATEGIMSIQPAQSYEPLPVPATPAAQLEMAPAPSRIARWVSELAHAAKAAESIVDTPLCPDAWWPLPPGTKLWNVPDRNPRVPLPDEPAESFHRRRQVAISTGAVVLSAAESLGLETLAAAVTGVYVVGAKPSLYAETMLGLLHEAGWRSRMVERSATRGAVALWRRSEQEESARIYEFTMEQAIGAGYVPGKGPNAGTDQYGKPKRGGNEQYVLRPETMLYWRAVSIGCRLEAPELMKGMKSAEELADEVERDSVTVTADVASAPSVGRVSAAAITSARELPEPATEARQAAAVMRAAPSSGPSALAQATLAREAVASTALDRDPEGGTRVLPALPGEEPSSEGENRQEPQISAEIDPGVWRQINARFVEIGAQVRGLTGPGQKESRLQVLSAIVERAITKGSDLTADEGRLVIDQLTGEAGVRACQSILHSSDQAAAAQDHAASIDEQIAAARADADARAAQHDAEQAQADEIDPTAGDDPWAGVEG